MASSCIVAMYHYVRDVEQTDFPAIKALSVADFEKQLDWLQQTSDVLSFPAFMEALSKGRSGDRPASLLTFDDGFIDHARTVTPILKNRGLSGVFFMPDPVLAVERRLLNVHRIHFLMASMGTEACEAAIRAELGNAAPVTQSSDDKDLYRYDAVATKDLKKLLNYDLPHETADSLLATLFAKYLGDERIFSDTLYVDAEDIRSMAEAGMAIGGHTKNHRVLSRLTSDEQRTELEQAPSLIRSLTGQSSIPFAFPYGHRQTYTDATLAILKDCGYSAAFTTFRGTVAFPHDKPFELERLDTKDLPPFTAGVPS